MTTADCRHPRRRLVGVNGVRARGRYYCPYCGRTTNRAVKRCGCYIDRAYDAVHPITREAMVLTRRAHDPSHEECKGSGWLPTRREGQRCCCALLAYRDRCRNCQDAQGLIHVCTVETAEDQERLDDLAAMPSPRRRGKGAIDGTGAANGADIRRRIDL